MHPYWAIICAFVDLEAILVSLYDFCYLTHYTVLLFSVWTMDLWFFLLHPSTLLCPSLYWNDAKMIKTNNDRYKDHLYGQLTSQRVTWTAFAILAMFLVTALGVVLWKFLKVNAYFILIFHEKWKCKREHSFVYEGHFCLVPTHPTVAFVSAIVPVDVHTVAIG